MQNHIKWKYYIRFSKSSPVVQVAKLKSIKLETFLASLPDLTLEVFSTVLSTNDSCPKKFYRYENLKQEELPVIYSYEPVNNSIDEMAGSCPPSIEYSMNMSK